MFHLFVIVGNPVDHGFAVPSKGIGRHVKRIIRSHIPVSDRFGNF
jgi:hypothetical protein